MEIQKKKRLIYFLLTSLTLLGFYAIYKSGEINRNIFILLNENGKEVIGTVIRESYNGGYTVDVKYEVDGVIYENYITKQKGYCIGDKFSGEFLPKNPKISRFYDNKPVFLNSEMIKETRGDILHYNTIGEDWIIFGYSVGGINYERTQVVIDPVDEDKDYLVKYSVLNPQRSILYFN